MISDDVDQLIYEISGRTGPTNGRGRSISDVEGYIFIYSFFASLASFFSNRLLLRSVGIYEYAPPPPPNYRSSAKTLSSSFLWQSFIGLVENAGTRICGYADMRVCGYADMRVCGYAGMRIEIIKE